MTNIETFLSGTQNEINLVTLEELTHNRDTLLQQFIEIMKVDAPKKYAKLKYPITYEKIKEKKGKGKLDCMYHVYDNDYYFETTKGVDFFAYMDNINSVINELIYEGKTLLCDVLEYDTYNRNNLFETSKDELNALPLDIFNNINWFDVAELNVPELTLVTYNNNDYYIV